MRGAIERVRRGIGVLTLVSCAACGYASVYGPSSSRLHVRLVRSLVPDAIASDEVAAGVRDELAREGALEPGDGYPYVAVEVLRDDESSEGIAARAGVPAARATGVAVVARAWIVRAEGAPLEGDTGDVRAEATITVDALSSGRDPRASLVHHADGLRAVARRLGRKLGQRVMGYPAPSEDEPSM